MCSFLLDCFDAANMLQLDCHYVRNSLLYKLSISHLTRHLLSRLHCRAVGVEAYATRHLLLGVLSERVLLSLIAFSTPVLLPLSVHMPLILKLLLHLGVVLVAQLWRMMLSHLLVMLMLNWLVSPLLICLLISSLALLRIHLGIMLLLSRLWPTA